MTPRLVFCPSDRTHYEQMKASLRAVEFGGGAGLDWGFEGLCLFGGCVETFALDLILKGLLGGGRGWVDGGPGVREEAPGEKGSADDEDHSENDEAVLRGPGDGRSGHAGRVNGKWQIANGK